MRRPLLTRLEPVTKDFATRVGGALGVGRFRHGAGYDVVLSGQGLIWMASTTDGRRFGAAIPTLLRPEQAGPLAVADVEGDRRDEVVGATAEGRIVVIRAGARRRLAHSVLPRSAPLITADGVAYPVVSCTQGAGACVGYLSILDGMLPLRLAPGTTVRVRLPVGAFNQVGAVPLLRWVSPVAAAQRALALTAPTPAERAAACAPPPRSGVLTRGRDFVAIHEHNFVMGGPTFDVSVLLDAHGCAHAAGGRGHHRGRGAADRRV